MNTLALEKVIEQVEKNNRVALVTVISESGISPARVGLMMAVEDDGKTTATVGGGHVELEITKKALIQLKIGESNTHTYRGENAVVEVFIRVFETREKLIIAGGGHVAHELYKIGHLQKFYTVIFDSREDCANREKFKFADEIFQGDVGANLRDYNIDDKCFIVACGPTHKQDEETLRATLGRGAKYIGMLGSRKKIKSIKEHLSGEGISDKELDSVYAPIGITTGGDTVAEISFGIFGEILAVKNDCTINHMKDIKK